MSIRYSDLVVSGNTGGNIADDSIDSSKIIDESIQSIDLSNSLITTDKLSSNAVTIDKLSPNLRVRNSSSNIVVNPNFLEDVAGVGYRAISDAVTYANANATESLPIIIFIATNVDLISPIVLDNPWVSIQGSAIFNPTIFVQDSVGANSAIEIDYSSVQTNAPISDLNIVGTTTLETTTGSYGLTVSGLGVMYFNNIRTEKFDRCITIDNQRVGVHRVFMKGAVSVRDGGTYGIYLDNTNVNFSDIALVESPVNLFAGANSECLLESGAIAGFTEAATGVGVEIVTGGALNLNQIEITNLAEGCRLNGGNISFNSCVFNNNVKDAIVNVATDIRTSNTEINLGKADFNVPSILTGTFFNVKEGDLSYNIFEELTVGSPIQGYEASLGEGDSYSTSALYFSFDGTTFTNVKEDLRNVGGGSYTFPNNNVGTALYISNIFGTQFLGLNTIVTTNALIGDSMVFEYFDGTNWVEFNHMITQASGQYLPFGNNFFTTFSGLGSFNIFFDERISEDWAVNDPIGLGQSFFWIRLRLIADPLTLPVFDQIKINPNHSKLGVDGTVNHFGLSRPIEKFPVTYGTFVAGLKSPANRDIFLSDNVFAGRNENRFQNGTVDATGLAVIVPYNLDTSCPIKVRLNIQGESNSAGTVRFQIRWAFTFRGAPVYINAGAAPATAPNERSIIQTNTYTAAQIYRTVAVQTYELEIPELITQFSGGDGGDLLFISIERDGNADSYNGDITINDIAFDYTAWRMGGHVLGQ